MEYTDQIALEGLENKGPPTSTVRKPGRPAPPPSVEGAMEHFKIRTAKDIVKRKVEWLWGRYIPKGQITLLTGDPQAGKSTLVCELLAALSKGRLLPGDNPEIVRIPRESLLMSSEDDAGTTILPRLENQECDPCLVHITDERTELDEPGLEKLKLIIESRNIAIVVVDTLTTWMHGDVDMNRANDVMQWLYPLRELAQKTGCAFLLLRHRRKGPVKDNKLHAGMGSIGWTAAARSELMVTMNDKTGVRTLTRTKGNIGAPPESLCYTIEDGPDPEENPHGILKFWSGQEVERLAGPKVPKVSKALRKAQDWLKARLGEGDVESSVLIAEALEAGHSKPTLDRAKEGVARSENREGVWFWCLGVEKG